ncbi:MAG: methyltransferase domain-containing protein [Vicinamibacteria bacterium]
MSTPFDTDAVRAAWDRAADAYAEGQATGRDIYRYEVFGPAQMALCGDVAGARLLDVGCGAGYFARAMAERGARVTAIDLSPRLLEHARAGGGPVDYRLLDAEAIAEAFPPGSFDVVTSCFSLQDMPDPPRVLAAVAAVLAPGGRVVVSSAHPCTDMPYRRWQQDAAGAKQALAVDRYFERGPLRYDWSGWLYPFTTAGLHVPLEDWFAWFRAAGLVVHALREPAPPPEAIARHPELEDAARVPYFILFDLRRA